jgi:hypothetical protein
LLVETRAHFGRRTPAVVLGVNGDEIGVLTQQGQQSTVGLDALRSAADDGWPMTAWSGGFWKDSAVTHRSCGSVLSPRNASSGACVDKVASHQRLALIIGVPGVLIAVGGGLFLTARREPAPADPVAA